LRWRCAGRRDRIGRATNCGIRRACDHPAVGQGLLDPQQARPELSDFIS
jgi:hypothetical protein